MTQINLELLQENAITAFKYHDYYLKNTHLNIRLHMCVYKSIFY